MAYAQSVFCNLSRLLERRLNWQRIFYIQYTNPGCYPPLHHSSRILANAGWDVLFFGTKSFGSSGILKLPPDPRIRLKIFSYPARGLLKLHYLWFCVRVLWKTFWWRPAWLYASDILSYPAALLASLLTGTRVILHEHDSPSHKNQFSRLLLWTRAQLARRACLNILPSAPRAQAFRKEMQVSAVQVVWNCPLNSGDAGSKGWRRQRLLRALLSRQYQSDAASSYINNVVETSAGSRCAAHRGI